MRQRQAELLGSFVNWHNHIVAHRLLKSFITLDIDTKIPENCHVDLFKAVVSGKKETIFLVSSIIFQKATVV